MANEINYDDGSSMGTRVDSSGSVTLESPFCNSLRSKKHFMIDRLATDSSDYLDSSNHCWCRETQLVVGPDGNRVHPTRCSPGRSCYSSAIENL